MLFKSFIIFIVTVVFLLLVAWGPSVRVPVRLSEKDASTTVEMYIGDILEVMLKGNPTTGYMWEVASVDASILRQVGETKFKADSKALGSGGKIIMRFKAAGAGQTFLRLIYHRTFEENIPPVKAFEVTIVVKR